MFILCSGVLILDRLVSKCQCCGFAVVNPPIIVYPDRSFVIIKAGQEDGDGSAGRPDQHSGKNSSVTFPLNAMQYFIIENIIISLWL